ncbi:uncharacterized protein LOC129720456 [Wyeomyia smithii]|uniref:uncharacterized protein LOC129720456 n=1 Tax=Wyeomyia smithii TaxID=174621 RepID=UPI002467F88F|nr:uncharacterized protein LOC129720456 [Wyeomyia smithii]
MNIQIAVASLAPALNLYSKHQGSDAGSEFNLATNVPVSVSAPSAAAADIFPSSLSYNPEDIDNKRQLNSSNNNSKRSSDSARSGNTKATVHINGVTIDHFQQNSDVDEDRVSAVMAGDKAAADCGNSDVQGFISYSSDSSMIELNLKFKKCACNENIINISKENLQRHGEPQRSAKQSSLDIETVLSAAASTTFSKEGKSKKLLQLDKDNLNSLVTKLNDTNSSSSSCTKCRLSLDIKNILKQIVSDKETTNGTQLQAGGGDTHSRPKIVGTHLPIHSDSECNRTLTVDKLGGSPSKAASWSPLIPSPLSPSPSPSVTEDDSSRLQRRHSETVERRSIGVQHGLRAGYRKKPQLRKGRTQVEEIIVISDEFRRQSLCDQKVRIHKAKKFSKSMESIDQKVVEETPPAAHGVIECLHLEDDTLTVVLDSDTANPSQQKSKSKSVDDISLSSNHNEEEFVLPVNRIDAANSVELIFISDEFVQRKSKQDVIIVDSGSMTTATKSLKRKKSASKNMAVVVDEQLKASAGGRKSRDVVRLGKSSSLKSSKDPRRKTTISNSNSFLTYEEPFSPETLESKDIGTMFAEAATVSKECAPSGEN